MFKVAQKEFQEFKGYSYGCKKKFRALTSILKIRWFKLAFEEFNRGPKAVKVGHSDSYGHHCISLVFHVLRRISLIVTIFLVRINFSVIT